MDRVQTWRHDGAMTTFNKPTTVRDLDRINLRLSAKTFGLIDALRADRLGNISRNTWITEAIAEKLARETSANDHRGEGMVANG